MTKAITFKHRKLIWKTLSHLYSDTKPLEYGYIARQLLALDEDFETLKRIDLYEVFPVFQARLWSVSGVWNEFDEDELYRQCEKMYHKRDNLLFRYKTQLQDMIFYRMREKEWHCLQDAIKINA